jgi:protein tyrosine phosphatase
MLCISCCYLILSSCSCLGWCQLHSCENGGECRAGNTSCSCEGTGFYGLICTIPNPTVSASASSSSQNAGASLTAAWVIIALVALVVCVMVAVVLQRRKRAVGSNAIAPVSASGAPLKPGQFDWQGIDDADEQSIVATGRPIDSIQHERIPLASIDRTHISLEQRLADLEDGLITDGVKAPRYQSEFDSAPKRKATGTFHASQHQSNTSKNRYRDILAYDDTRVRLVTTQNDYINANHVSVTVGKQQFWYIASQGPMNSTLADFWQMIWENQIHVVAMVTSEMEKGVQKCAAYWPSELGDQSVWRNFEVTLLRARSNDAYTIRGLQVRNTETGEKRVVWQLHYTGWPDHGVPSDPFKFLMFVDELRNIRHRVSPSNHAALPTLIHCSAGIGRTGVLIMVESALARLENDLPIVFASTLNEIREQRAGMVQTVDQYKFCSETLIATIKQQIAEKQTSA